MVPLPRGDQYFKDVVLQSDTRVYTTIVNRTMFLSAFPQESKYLTFISARADFSLMRLIPLYIICLHMPDRNQHHDEIITSRNLDEKIIIN